MRAVGEIAKLRFPQAEHARIIERVSVIEPEHGRFGKQAVVNANARLLFRHVHERHVGFARLAIVKNGMARAERSARAVLSRQPDWNSLQQQRAECELFRVMPFVEAALLENLASMFEHDALDLWLDVEIFRHPRQRIDNRLERFFSNRGRLRRASVFRLENGG